VPRSTKTHLSLSVALLLPAAVVAAAGGDETLTTFLAEVESAGRFQTPARADLSVRVKDGEEERTYDGVVIHRGADTYLEFRDPAVRVLIRGNEKPVHVLLGGAAHGAERRAHDPIDGTTLIADDFRPFRAALRIPQITSENTRMVLVNGEPAEPSRYVLIVQRLDRDKKLPTRVQYYERTINNLVRMRTETDLVRVANAWRPRVSKIEDYGTGTVTTIERRWSPSAEVPAGLFDPATLGSHSLLGH
jgi:hypothetical protein